MSRRLSRGELAKALPDQPRLRGQLETLDDAHSDLADEVQALNERIDALAALIGDGSIYQPSSALLDAIAALPNRIGAVEVKEGPGATIRPIDSQDPASLLSRGAAYTVLVGIGGLGPTASRPVLPTGYVAIYFDTDIDPDGEPIILRPDGQWLTMGGAPV